MDQAPRMAFSHIGLYVADMAAMVSFYTGVLGFSITDQAHIRGADVVFLSRNPDEHHQIVLVPGRSPQSPSTLNQISFRVVSLPELRRLHAELLALGVRDLNPPTMVDLGLCTSLTQRAIGSNSLRRPSGTCLLYRFPLTSHFPTTRYTP